jgi:uncharacterized membrane protein YecN with MAPEG domain
MHAENVVNLLNGLLIIAFILLATLEKYFTLPSYVRIGSEDERSGLVDKEAPTKNWSEVLNRNIENFVPYCFSLFFLNSLCFPNIQKREDFHNIIYAILGLQYVFFISRISHAIGYMKDHSILRSSGFGVTAAVNVAMSFLGVALSFVEKFPTDEIVNGIQHFHSMIY